MVPTICLLSLILLNFFQSISFFGCSSAQHLIRIHRWHITEQVYISTEWVLVLQKLVVVSILGDGTGLAWLLVVLIARYELLLVPSNLLRCRLLPLWALAGDAFVASDALLHRFDFEDSVNARWVVRHPAAHTLALRSNECLEFAGVSWVRVDRFLCNEFNYKDNSIIWKCHMIVVLTSHWIWNKVVGSVLD